MERTRCLIQETYIQLVKEEYFVKEMLLLYEIHIMPVPTNSLLKGLCRKRLVFTLVHMSSCFLRHCHVFIIDTFIPPESLWSHKWTEFTQSWSYSCRIWWCVTMQLSGHWHSTSDSEHNVRDLSSAKYNFLRIGSCN